MRTASSSPAVQYLDPLTWLTKQECATATKNLKNWILALPKACGIGTTNLKSNCPFWSESALARDVSLPGQTRDPWCKGWGPREPQQPSWPGWRSSPPSRRSSERRLHPASEIHPRRRTKSEVEKAIFLQQPGKEPSKWKRGRFIFLD